MPSNDPRPTKNDRREAARAEAARLRAEQERKARRTRLVAISALAAAVVALGVVVAVVLTRSASNREAYGEVAYGAGAEGVVAPELADVTAPAAANDEGGITVTGAGVGEPGDAPVDLTVYLDYQCPFCAQFEAANGEMLAERVAAGDISVDYRILTFLDSASNGTFYSTRAANAAAVVADRSPEHFLDLTQSLFARQPAEGTSGLTDEEIAEIATEVGVPENVTEDFTATVTGTFTEGGSSGEGTWRTFAPWLAAATAKASADLGGISTPTILVDGERFEGNPITAGPLEEAIDLALAG
ncbi:DsbA family protein [Cellulomonas endophytica]|uniref:DsbA family protein n=1 Tax=Cellulomonas endophytica TaxID=2494735 RepID=UPI0010109CB5|nr:thioredoxin domain-containing protein [Cellulomonas endophytica]